MLLRKSFTLAPYTELHVSVPPRAGSASAQPATITLLPPTVDNDDDTTCEETAEIAGWELAPSVPVVLSEGSSVGIWTPSGCTVTVEGPAAVLGSVYADSLMAAYHRSVLDLHAHLEGRREEARADAYVGPRVLVCGVGHDTGKSTLATTIANYGVRSGHSLLYVDCDLAHPTHGLPHCLNIYDLQHPVDPEVGTLLVPGQHICVGHSTPTGSPGMYRHCVREAAELVKLRWSAQQRSLFGGLVIDYPTLSIATIEAVEQEIAQLEIEAEKQTTLVKSPLAQLRFTAEALVVDTIVVVGSTWMREALLRTFPGSPSSDLLVVRDPSTGEVTQEVAVIYFDASVSAAARSERARGRDTDVAAERYFRGNAALSLVPAVVEVPLEAVRLVQLSVFGAESMQTMLAMDTDLSDAHVEVAELPPGSVEAGTILAVSEAVFLRYPPGADPYDGFAVPEAVEAAALEDHLRCARVRGLVTVLAVSDTHYTLQMPCDRLPQPVGCCLITGYAAGGDGAAA